MLEPSRTEIAEFNAVVFPAGVPGDELDALPALYGSLGSTAPFFCIYDHLDAPAACVLRDPHHVFVLRKDGCTVEVLNRTCDVPARDVERACRAIFRAFPDVRRVHIDVLFPPSELELPVRFLSQRNLRSIPLPGGPDEYVAALGRHTRRNLRAYERRWSRDHPGAEVQIVRTGERSGELFELFCAWKHDRFAEKGKAAFWDGAGEVKDQFVALLRALGEAQIVSVEGEPAGLVFFFQVGATLDSSEGAYDTQYEPCALGTLMHYWMTLEAARRGAARVCLGAGPNEYFRRFGSITRPASRISVFRSDWARLDSLDEATEAGRRRLRLAARASWWKARHKAGVVLRKTTGRSPRSD